MGLSQQQTEPVEYSLAAVEYVHVVGDVVEYLYDKKQWKIGSTNPTHTTPRTYHKHSALLEPPVHTRPNVIYIPSFAHTPHACASLLVVFLDQSKTVYKVELELATLTPNHTYNHAHINIHTYTSLVPFLSPPTIQSIFHVARTHNA
jgi:hypothetical protein